MVANWVNHPFKVKRKKTKRLKVKYVEEVFDRYCYVVVEVLVMVELIHCWANLDTYHWSVLLRQKVRWMGHVYILEWSGLKDLVETVDPCSQSSTNLLVSDSVQILRRQCCFDNLTIQPHTHNVHFEIVPLKVMKVMDGKILL